MITVYEALKHSLGPWPLPTDSAMISKQHRVDLACCPQEEEVVLTADSNISDLSNLSFTSGEWSASNLDALDSAIALLSDRARFSAGNPPGLAVDSNSSSKASCVVDELLLEKEVRKLDPPQLSAALYKQAYNST